MEKKKGFFTKALDVIERVGNKLPDPFVLFIGLAFFMILLSFVFSLFGATVAHPGTGEELQIRNLLSGEGLQFILTSMLENFTGFAPLGLVLAMMLGIGLAEKVGLLDYAIRKTILKSPPFLLTYTVVFTGILGNLASDAAVVLVPPLGALVFYKVGRHPLAGLAARLCPVQVRDSRRTCSSQVRMHSSPVFRRKLSRSSTTRSPSHRSTTGTSTSYRCSC